MAGNALFWMIAVMLVICIIPPVLSLFERWWVFDGNAHKQRLAGLMDERERQGVPWERMQDELYVREAFARLRREASEAVFANPGEWWTGLDNAKREAIKRVKEEQPHLVASFCAMGSGLSYGHILYSDAAAIVDRSMCGHDFQPSEDQVAALRIVRPS